MRWAVAALALAACTRIEWPHGHDAACDVAVDAGGDPVRLKVIAPLGLITQPGEYGLPPGALSKALNVCMRDPGLINSLPDVRAYRADVIGSGYTLRRLFPGDSNVLTIGDNAGTWAARWVSSGASTAITGPTGYTLTFGTAKAQWTRTRERYFVTSEIGIQALDSESDTSMRHAGFPPPITFWTSSSSTNAGAIANGKAARWRSVVRRKQSDAYETISAPSTPVYYANGTGATVDPSFVVQWEASHGIAAGDIIELYRTKTQNTGTDPGDTFYLVASYTVTSSDVTNTSATVPDRTPDTGIGAELYTNPGDANAGPNKPKFPPPYATDVVTFKGHTFYFQTSTAASIKLLIPAVIGSLSSAYERTRGIGLREAACNTTSGSPTLSGVSATDILGVVAGQYVTGTGIPAATTVSSVNAGAGTITMSANATATGAITASIYDRIDIDGSASAAIDNYKQLVEEMVEKGLVVVSNEALNTDDVNGAEFSIQQPRYADGSFTIRATNGANYTPALPNIADTATTVAAEVRNNRYYWSEAEQPEAVPLLNYGFCGSGTHYRGIATRDAIYVFASDGLWRISGDAGVWRVDPVDPRLILAARNAVDVLGDVIWAYTNRGLVSISGDVVTEHSTGTIGDLVTGAAYSDSWDTYLACDELHREVWLTFRSGGDSTSYVFNILTKAFTSVNDDEWSAMAYSRALQSLVIGEVAANPDVLYFESDTSATRMPGADARYQPLDMGDPFTLKEFQDLEFIFGGMSGGTATLVPSFDGTTYTSVTVPQSSLESRARVMVPRNAPAIDTRIAPGFTLSAGGTSQNWHLRGVSVRFVPAGEEGSKR